MTSSRRRKAKKAMTVDGKADVRALAPYSPLPTYNHSAAKKGKTNAKSKTKAKAKPPPPAVQPAISAYRPTVSAEKEEDFMNDLLGNMDHVPAKPVTRPRKRKPEPDVSYDHNGSSPLPHRIYRSHSNDSGRGYGSADPDTSSDGPYYDDGVGPSSGDDYMFSPKKKQKTESSDITPAIEGMGQLGVESGTDDADTSFDDMDMDAFMDVDDDDLDMKPKPKVEVDSSAKPLKPINGNAPPVKKKLDDNPAWLSVYDSLKVASDDSFGPAASSAARTPALTKVSILEEDGSLRFYWLDYLEHDGRLYFIGKAQDKKTKVWVSICVTVENIERNLFVLPRDRRLAEDEDTGEMYETDKVPDLQDIYMDFDRLRKKAGIKAFKGKFVKRKYAFGEKDVPREERQWLKVVYSFTGEDPSLVSSLYLSSYYWAEPQLPNTASSPNFSRIFGTNTSAFELLVLKRKIMGPCWLQIKHPEIDHKGVSTYVTSLGSVLNGRCRRFRGVRSRRRCPIRRTSTPSLRLILMHLGRRLPLQSFPSACGLS